MDATENVVNILPTGIVIATFLLNTNRIPKAIELLKECLFVLNNVFKAMGREDHFARKLYLAVCSGMFGAYKLISDNASAIEWGRNMLVLLRESGERYQEGRLSFELGQLYQLQSNYQKAKQFYREKKRRSREEAEMIGRLLDVKPLIEEHATKQAVLRDIHSVSLIHFAAHGDAERGEIALAPLRPFNGSPQEKDYLLTMAEIAQVRLRAKLVVLSCCYSAGGEIRSEGVVGIARAFLGSGARSVLVALWDIDDEATMQFMSRFYENLVRGESTSESLHQAMKWMRSNRFSNVRKWAPFMLIGDNVTFDFRK